MKKLQRYTQEFRAEAINLVFEQSLSLETAAKRLGIPKGTLGNWMASAKSSATYRHLERFQRLIWRPIISDCARNWPRHVWSAIS